MNIKAINSIQNIISSSGISSITVCCLCWLNIWPSVFKLEYEKKKKSEGKMVRAERQVVLDMLFSAFEKHQYYNIKDLVDITKQPVVR